VKPLLFLSPALVFFAIFFAFYLNTPAPKSQKTPPDSQDRPPKAGEPGVADSAAARRLRFAVTDRDGFVRMKKPQPGEWLAEHEEAGQTFGEYVRSRPVKAVPEQNVLAFLPVGPFGEKERKVSLAAVEFAGLWFGLPTRVLPAAELPGEEFRRVREFSWSDGPTTQYHTDAFLRRILPRNLPDDAVMLAGVTMGDLYPGAGWNYVFGMATFRRRVGVYSLVRYFPEFWGRPATDETRRTALRRSMKLVTHELGHCFGLMHCIDFECNMNGSNSLRESDSRPLPLCPKCLRKLQWNRGFDVLDRYRTLLGFYRREGLEDEAAWTERRVRRIGSVR
jgi:archaemetzincin